MNSKHTDFSQRVKSVPTNPSLFSPMGRETVPGRDLRGFLIHDIHPSLVERMEKTKCEFL
jgi:hypothetical protein